MANPKPTTVTGLNDFHNIFLKVYNGKSASPYCNYVNRLEALCQKLNSTDSIANWIVNAIDNKSQNPVNDLMNQMIRVLNTPSPLNFSIKWKPKTIDDYLCGFRKYVKAVLGVFYANTWMDMYNNDAFFCKLVAQNALFPSEEVVNDVKNGKLGTKDCKNRIKRGALNPYASWDYMLHFRDTSKPRNTEIRETDCNFINAFPMASETKLTDDNNYANQYIKKAIQETIEGKKRDGIKLFAEGFRKFYDYEACHVWDMPGDRCYYASIPNLVLLPRALAQLTDHNDAVKELLRYEVYKRFKFVPFGQTQPSQPKNYSAYKKQWRRI